MTDWTPEQLADQKKICECNHFKNTHSGGQWKCLFDQLQKVNGYPGEAECPCQAFIEDKKKTSANIDRVAEAKAKLNRITKKIAQDRIREN